jgi:hypothetical protein
MMRSPLNPLLQVRQFRKPWRNLFLPACIWLLVVLMSWGPPARADSLTSFGLVRSEDGLYLDFNVGFELSPSVEAALQKGVALNFVAEAQVFRERWYWRDQRVSRVTRAWRLSYQPLTRQYRVGFGSAQLGFDNVADALALVQRVSQWKVVEAADLSPSGQYYLQLTYQLDTSALPRPVQVGVGGQPDWALLIQKTQRVPAVAAQVLE